MITEIILLLLAIPTGLILAWLAKEELKEGRKWFKALVIASIALAFFFWIFGVRYVSLTFAFIAVASLVSLIKGSK